MQLGLLEECLNLLLRNATHLTGGETVEDKFLVCLAGNCGVQVSCQLASNDLIVVGFASPSDLSPLL